MSERKKVLLPERLRHIRDAIDSIIANTEGKSLDDLQADTNVAKAVLYDLYVMGEASGKIRHRFPELAKEPLLRLKAAQNMRHHVSHGYFHLRWKAIWGTIQHEIRPMRDKVDELIKELEAGQANEQSQEPGAT